MKPSLVKAWSCTNCQEIYKSKKKALECCLCITCVKIPSIFPNVRCKQCELKKAIKWFEDALRDAKKGLTKSRKEYQNYITHKK